MSDPTIPSSLVGELREIRRRLDALERSPQIPFSSTRGGAFTFRDDDDGLPRWAMGNVDLEGGLDSSQSAVYGVLGFDDAGAITYAQQQGTRGRIYPAQPFPMHLDSTPETITSATFQDLWIGRLNRPALDVLLVQCPVVTDSATTGQIRLLDLRNNNTTAAFTVPVSTSGFVRFAWVHPATIGMNDPVTPGHPNLVVRVQARRASGAGLFAVFPPVEAEVTSSFIEPDAAINGNPVLIT